MPNSNIAATIRQTNSETNEWTVSEASHLIYWENRDESSEIDRMPLFRNVGTFGWLIKYNVLKREWIVIRSVQINVCGNTLNVRLSSPQCFPFYGEIFTLIMYLFFFSLRPPSLCRFHSVLVVINNKNRLVRTQMKACKSNNHNNNYYCYYNYSQSCPFHLSACGLRSIMYLMIM